MTGSGKSRSVPAGIMRAVMAVITAGLLLSACSSRPHLHWTCEERYNVCLDQCASNNDYLYEKISNQYVIELELAKCQQECELKYQYCLKSGCPSCR